MATGHGFLNLHARQVHGMVNECLELFSRGCGVKQHRQTVHRPSYENETCPIFIGEDESDRRRLDYSVSTYSEPYTSYTHSGRGPASLSQAPVPMSKKHERANDRAMDKLRNVPSTSHNAHSNSDGPPILFTGIKKELDLTFVKQDLGEKTGRRQPWISDRNAVLDLYKNDGNQSTLLVGARADVPFSNFRGHWNKGQSRNSIREQKLKKEIKEERVDCSPCQHERFLMKSSYYKASALKSTNNEPGNLGEYSPSNSASIPTVSTAEKHVHRSAQAPRNNTEQLRVSGQRLDPGLVSIGLGSQTTTALCPDIRTEKENEIPPGRIRPETDRVSDAEEVRSATGHSSVDRAERPKTSFISDMNLTLEATSTELFMFNSQNGSAVHPRTCSSSLKQCFPTSADQNVSFVQPSPPSKTINIQSETSLDKLQTAPAPTQKLQSNPMEEPAHPCGKCQMSFHSKYALFHHISQKHPETVLDETRLLTKLTPEEKNVTRVAMVGGSYLLYKMGESAEKRYQCLKCDYGSGREKDIEKHLMNHFGIRPYVCRVCQKGYPTSAGLLIHTETHAEVKSHACKVCGAAFGGIRLLKAHMLKHGVFKCGVCYKTFSSNSTFRYHMKSHDTGVNYLCEYCGETFTNREFLRSHLDRHSSVLAVNQYPCAECGKLLPSEKRRKVHFKKVHRRTHQCEKCTRLFHSARVLQTHILQYHQETMPFVCEKCGKGFRQSSQLKAHAFTHTGEKPYKCSECSAGFTRSDYLRKHELTHSGEKPYLCNVCGKGFSRKSNLNVHVEWHKRAGSSKQD